MTPGRDCNTKSGRQGEYMRLWPGLGCPILPQRTRAGSGYIFAEMPVHIIIVVVYLGFHCKLSLRITYERLDSRPLYALIKATER